MYFDNIAALRAQTSVPLNTEFIVGGYATPGDGGGGTFIWIPKPSPYLDDGGIVLYSDYPADNKGYFQRIFSGPINVRWFGAKGTGLVDDTAAVHRARDSKAFADNGTLYFPVGTYKGAFIFDLKGPQPAPDPPLRNETNIIGDGHGTILKSNGTGDPVVTLGYRTIRFPSSNWMWSKISDLTIIGEANLGGTRVDGVVFANPSTDPDPTYNSAAGRWVLERILFKRCRYGVFKKYGNIGNHFIDCTFNENKVGVYAQAAPDGMQAGNDKYTGGLFENHTEACLQYIDNAPMIIIDGTTFQFNHTAWAIYISIEEQKSMTWSGICIRNVWLEDNGVWDKDRNPNQTGGALYFKGVRSVRIEDAGIFNRIKLFNSSVSLYSCRLDTDKGGIRDDNQHIDKKSSIVAYEHRYLSYPTSKVFVNSISYDASQEIYRPQPYPNPPMIEGWQPTSVWGPLRSVKATLPYNVVVSTHFDTNPEPFRYIVGMSDVVYTSVSPMRVLGKGAGRLGVGEGEHIRSENVKGIIRQGKYIVWSIHTFLETPVPEGYVEDELFGDIKRNYDELRLGFIYFKYQQWVCSYGMKLVNITHDSEIVLDFQSAFNAHFYITDY